MRFYDITITDTAGNTIIIDGIPMRWRSHNDAGVMTPGALNVEWDIPTVSEGIPAGDSYLKIWGVDLRIVNKASMLHFQNITILAGMEKGLPLATEQASYKPARNGVIVQGSILQVFATWQGAEQSLDFIVTTKVATQATDTPNLKKVLVFNCAPNQSFSSALTKTMSDAGITSSINIDPRLVASEQITFHAANSVRFAQQILQQSQNIIKDPNYRGVNMIKTPRGYDFYDDTFIKAGIPIFFNDLIGQPTWKEFLVLQMKVVMRSDLKISDIVIFPDNQELLKQAILQAKFYNPSNQIEFTGTGQVNAVRHIANFRQADANSWVTVLDIIMKQKPRA